MPDIIVSTEEILSIKRDLASIRARLLKDLRDIAAIQESGRAGVAHQKVLDLIAWVESA